MSTAKLGSISKLAGIVPIQQLREDAIEEFEDLLASLPGRISLVMDPAILRVMPHIASEGPKYLAQLRVESTYPMEEDTEVPEEGACNTVLFVLQPTLAAVDVLVGILQRARPDTQLSLRACFVPRATHEAVQRLKAGNVLGNVTFSGEALLEWGLDVLPLDDDLMTLVGQEHYFRDAVLWGGEGAGGAAATTTCTPGLYYCARALMKLQGAYGTFPTIKAKGRLAKAVMDMMLRQQRENEVMQSRAPVEGGSSSSSSSSSSSASASASASGSASSPPSSAPPHSEFDMLILLDRGCDLATPLVMPFTVEAQIRETLGISHLTTEVDTALVADEEAPLPGRAPPPPRPRRCTVHLNSNDRLYREIRDAGVHPAGLLMKARARALQEQQEELRARKSVDMEHIKRSTKALPKFQEDKRSLRAWLGLMEPIQAKFRSEAVVGRWRLESDLLGLEDVKEAWKAAWEECSRQLARGDALPKALRLLCLASVVAGGLRWKEYDAAWREVVAFYGPPAAFTLVGLERAGLLTYRGGEGGVASMLGVSGQGVCNGVWEKLSRLLGLVAAAGEGGGEEGEAGGGGPRPPADLHYTTMGYAPLSVRLCQAAACSPGGWEAPGVMEALRLLPGPTSSVSQGRGGVGGGGSSSSAAAAAAAAVAAAAAAAEKDAGGGRKVVLVCYVGGVTHVEISALRFLSEKYPVDFLILGTSILDGESLIASFVDPLHAKFGLVEGAHGHGHGHGHGRASHAGGGEDGEGEGEGEEEGEEEEQEEEEEVSARDQVIKGLVAGAGKLGERPKPAAPAEKKGVFGSLFGGGGGRK